MEPTSRPIPKSARNHATESMIRFHCACGFDFLVAASLGGECPQCKSFIAAEALRSATSETVSITTIQAEHDVHHFELEESQLLTNRLYGHFRIDRRLGTGGMGAVYRALDTSLQRYVAVKVLKNANQCADDRAATMLREAIAQARLNHPNVVTIYYVGRQAEEPFLAMELLSGPTLSERLKNEGSIPYGEAIRYAIQVASALDHAAQFGIVHADIKPANLILAGEGRIKLSDFGLSRIQHAKDQKQSISGTPAYVAPELIRGEALSIQSDMYALGITLFELVFGRSPYEPTGTSVRDRMEVHLTSPISFPASLPTSIPVEFKAVIERLLSKDPKGRYSNFAEMIVDLRRIEPVSTTTAGLALRGMAYAIDQLALLLCISPFAFTIFLLNSSEFARSGYQWLVPIVAFLSLIVPAIYLAVTFRGWRSIGRYLFQLRIVEENGLPARQEQLVAREVLRNAFAWFFPLLLYVDPMVSVDSDFETFGGRDLMVKILEIGLVLFIAVDWGTTLLLKGRKSLHDYLCHSRVVLAIDRNSGKE